MKTVLVALFSALATSAFACGLENPVCTLDQTTLVIEDRQFCLNHGENKTGRDGTAIEYHGHRIYAVTENGITRFMRGESIARCLDASVYLKEIPVN